MSGKYSSLNLVLYIIWDWGDEWPCHMSAACWTLMTFLAVISPRFCDFQSYVQYSHLARNEQITSWCGVILTRNPGFLLHLVETPSTDRLISSFQKPYVRVVGVESIGARNLCVHQGLSSSFLCNTYILNYLSGGWFEANLCLFFKQSELFEYHSTTVKL